MKWVIKDWTGEVRFDNTEFTSFDDAEEFLTEYFDSFDNADEFYDENRGEYSIERIK